MNNINRADELSRELTKLARELTKEQVVLVQKKVVFDLLAGVVKRTPVDYGRARSGWQVGVNELPADDASNGSATPSGGVITEAQKSMKDLPPYAIVYITNNVPYIVILDQGGFVPPDPGPSKDPRKHRKGKILVRGGYSIQAPNGMVDVTIAEILEALQ